MLIFDGYLINIERALQDLIGAFLKCAFARLIVQKVIK